MRVAVSFTLEIDRDGWATEFGVNPSDVRDDVRAYFETIALAQLRDVLDLNQRSDANRVASQIPATDSPMEES